MTPEELLTEIARRIHHCQGSSPSVWGAELKHVERLFKEHAPGILEAAGEAIRAEQEADRQALIERIKQQAATLNNH